MWPCSITEYSWVFFKKMIFEASVWMQIDSLGIPMQKKPCGYTLMCLLSWILMRNNITKYGAFCSLLSILSTTCCRIPSSGVLLLFDAEQHYSAVDVTWSYSCRSSSSVSASTERFDAAAGDGTQCLSVFFASKVPFPPSVCCIKIYRQNIDQIRRRHKDEIVSLG